MKHCEQWFYSINNIILHFCYIEFITLQASLLIYVAIVQYSLVGCFYNYVAKYNRFVVADRGAHRAFSVLFFVNAFSDYVKLSVTDFQSLVR